MPDRSHSCRPYESGAPLGRFEYRGSWRDRANRQARHHRPWPLSATLHKGLVVDPRDILLEKPRFGAFHGTDLELILCARGIDTIMVTGIATNVCCEATAHEATVRDFRVFFLSDGTATFGMGDLSASELQRATCATLGLLFAQVLTVDEMAKKISSATPGEADGDQGIEILSTTGSSNAAA